MRRICSGLYVDETTQTLHVDLAEMLVENGWPDTPENRRMLDAATREAFARQFPGIPIQSSDDPVNPQER